MARERKSEQQRAVEALAVAQRKVDRLEAEHGRLKSDLEAVTVQLTEARNIRDYRASHPMLPEQPESASGEDDTGAAGPGGGEG